MTRRKGRPAPLPVAWPPAVSPALSKLCPELLTWPERWMGDADDIPYGRGIVVALLPFAERLASGTLSPKTARRHIDHLWLLGGEMIRDVNMYDRYAEVTPADLLADSVDPDGGLYCRHLSANERRAYDATCRKLHAFLAAGGTAGARVP